MLVRSEAKSWERVLVEEARRALAVHSYWRHRLQEQGYAIHLAILVEPYLQYILDGKKTVESRFSVTRCAPYQRVETGDVILLKRAGGPIVGVCEVGNVWSYELEPSSWDEIRVSFTHALCAQDPDFWTARGNAAFATLMQVRNVSSMEPIVCMKRDRRGWVVLVPRSGQLEFGL